MIDQFVDVCLRNRVAVIVIALLLGVFGIYAWETLTVEAYPELGDVAAQVTTQMPGLDAERFPGVDAECGEQQRDDDHRDAPLQAEFYEPVNQ